MDKTYPPEAWQHLGKVLERRRGQLGYGFRQREQFLRDRGGPPPSVKMLARLERGERTTYPDSTVTLLESMYGYAPGSFEAILEGRDPVPVLGAAQTGPLRAVPDHDGSHADDASPESVAETLLAGYLAQYGDSDRILQLLATRPGASAETRLAEVLEWLQVNSGGTERNGTAG